MNIRTFTIAIKTVLGLRAEFLIDDFHPLVCSRWSCQTSQDAIFWEFSPSFLVLISDHKLHAFRHWI